MAALEPMVGHAADPPKAVRPFWFAPGQCQVVRRISCGGNATVYEATDVRFNIRLALKVSSPRASDSQLKRMMMEAELGRRLEHPSIPRTIRWGKFNGGVWVAMELFDGCSLFEVLDHPRLDGASRLRILADLAAAVEHVHQTGVLHRDIKPENILVTPSGAKLLDFGAARVPWVSLTEPNYVVGTPDYMAPEQVVGETLDERVDIYQLGLVAFDLFATRPAWMPNQSLVEIGRERCFDRPPKVSSFLRDSLHLPPEAIRRLDRLVAKCLRTSRRRRFDSAAALGRALHEMLAELPSSEEHMPHRLERPCAPRPVLLVGRSLEYLLSDERTITVVEDLGATIPLLERTASLQLVLERGVADDLALLDYFDRLSGHGGILPPLVLCDDEDWAEVFARRGARLLARRGLRSLDEWIDLGS